ncbi:MAG: HAMP domain-containing protein, partial [Dermatophilaceae bacterium]
MTRATGATERITRWLETMPLRRRLYGIVGAVLGAALLLTTVATASLMYRDLMTRIDRELSSVARPVATQAFDDLRSSRDAAFPTSYAFQLQSPVGEVLRLPTGYKDRPDLPALAVDDPRVRTGEPFTVESTGDGPRWRFVAGRVEDSGATFAVGVPLTSVNQTLTRLVVSSLLIGGVVVTLSLLLARLAVRRAFRPLSRIEDTAAAIAAGDLTQRVPVRQADDEVTSLSDSLNPMLARVEHSFSVREASEERMRQFVADASHELRTPLATVRGYAELYRQGAVPDSAAVASV